ncbi:hypothetical protein [Chryseobacterium sp. CT-SW4]
MWDKFNAVVSLAKVDSNGNLNGINTALQETAKPNGIIDEKAVVSKCP